MDQSAKSTHHIKSMESAHNRDEECIREWITNSDQQRASTACLQSPVRVTDYSSGCSQKTEISINFRLPIVKYYADIRVYLWLSYRLKGPYNEFRSPDWITPWFKGLWPHCFHWTLSPADNVVSTNWYPGPYINPPLHHSMPWTVWLSSLYHPPLYPVYSGHTAWLQPLRPHTLSSHHPDHDLPVQ